VTVRKPVLVTGNRGYIGAVMAPHLLRQGYDVVGLDVGYFDECTLVPDPVELPQIRKDIRDLVPDDLEAFYAIIHLAALSNDPIGNLDARWTGEINTDATIRLAELAREADVRRFLFSSSCIMYGAAAVEVVDETAPLDPKTEYARSKVQGETALRALARDGFSPTYLRNGTVYGLSPRMRFDTVLNDLVASAVTTGRIQVFSDGRPWRPVVHVEDVAQAFHHVLEAPAHVVHDQAFNTGADHLNHQVIELAEFAAAAVPGCEIEVLNQPSADQRTYRADFSKFARTFPEVDFRSTANAARALADAFVRVGLTDEQYRGKRFVRLRWLKHLLDAGIVDQNLRMNLR
jgi:nucleoside-diphosphate-sugar epimerase